MSGAAEVITWVGWVSTAVLVVEHPFASVMVTCVDPANSPLAVLENCGGLLAQAYVYGNVPPRPMALADPVPPKQVGFITEPIDEDKVVG